jgi:RNA polymerase sigma factor (sigma-70 family)
MHHEPWVRRLVRHLVTEGDVEDAVQQTWLAVLRQKGPVREPLSWLAGVARRQALMLRRREARIKKREGAADPVDRQDSTENIVAELAAQRSITKAVSELREPYSETVLLRFYRELSTQALR